LDALLGRVVYSKAGRDSGRRFVVVKVIDEIYVLISDGGLRKIEKPKKKKIKHLEVTGKVVVQLAEKLNKNLKVTNSEIRKALSAFENESKGET
jgi:large subunit ribosomal protein L14e